MNESDGGDEESIPRGPDPKSARSSDSLWRWSIASALGVFALSFWIFHEIFFTSITSDLKHHVDILIAFADGELGLPANSLYYLVIYALAGLRAESIPLFWAGSTTLAASTAARFMLDFRILGSSFGQQEKAPAAKPFLLLGLALVLTISFSLPTLAALQGLWYLGQTPPNVWHNSTTIFVMPFAIALFWVSYRNLAHPTIRGDVVIAGLCILNIISKPSFFLVFASTYPIMLVIQHGLRRGFWSHLWPVAAGGVLVGIQYYLLFSMQIGNRFREDSGVIFAPFEVWSYYSPNIPLSILASILYPLTYLAVYWRALPRQPMMHYALALYIVAISMTALLSESGPRRLHGNFFWQSYISSHILFLATTSQFARHLRNSRMGPREWLVVGVFALHGVAGVAYLIRLFVVGDYR